MQVQKELRSHPLENRGLLEIAWYKEYKTGLCRTERVRADAKASLLSKWL